MEEIQAQQRLGGDANDHVTTAVTHMIGAGVDQWRLIIQRFEQGERATRFWINNVRQPVNTLVRQQYCFGHDLSLTLDQASGKLTIKRSSLQSDLVYFCITDTQLLISNDIISLRSCSIGKQLNPAWMLRFFSCTDDFTHASPFQDIAVLPPLSSISITNGCYAVETETVAKQQATENWSCAQWVDQWRTGNLAAVRNSSHDQNRIAIMLSSGLDSAGLAAYLQAVCQTDGKPRHIKGFSWRFPNHQQADESHYIASLVRHLGLEHEFIDISDAECFDNISHWPVSFDAPYFNAMRRIKERLYQTVASQHFALLLNGHIGDELCFVDRYILAELWQADKAAFFSELLGLFKQQKKALWRDSGFRYWAKSIIKRRDRPPAAPAVFTPAAKQAYREQGVGYLFAAQRYEQYGLLTANSEINAIATEQCFARAYGIERRHPYLHVELVALALACPAYLLSTYRQTKWLSRQALSGLLPADILARQRVGQLDELFIQGLEKNAAAIKDYLFRQERRWSEYIREDVVLHSLENRQWQHAASVIVPCLGFERWLDEWRAVGLPVT